MLSQQVSFNPIQASLQSRMTNLPASAINAQPSILNQVVRLREPQKFAPSILYYTNNYLLRYPYLIF